MSASVVVEPLDDVDDEGEDCVVFVVHLHNGEAGDRWTFEDRDEALEWARTVGLRFGVRPLDRT